MVLEMRDSYDLPDGVFEQFGNGDFQCGMTMGEFFDDRLAVFPCRFDPGHLHAGERGRSALRSFVVLHSPSDWHLPSV